MKSVINIHNTYTRIILNKRKKKRDKEKQIQKRKRARNVQKKCM